MGLDFSTQGIKYAGSKLKLLSSIFSLVEDLSVRSFWDAFAGTTRVSQAAVQMNWSVVCSDISDWSKVFGNCFLKAEKDDSFYQKLIDHLNALPGTDGWFTEHYGGENREGNSVQADGCKRLWQLQNTRKLDAVRPEIDRLALDPVDRDVLLTSLILALDEVDNTIGHYAAYLKKWSPRSNKTMLLKVPRLLRKNTDRHRILQGDVFKICPEVKCDLAYLDPPYGSNNEKMPPSRVRYASYYHVWTTVIRNDRPALFGAAARRTDSSDRTAGSVFEEFRKSPAGGYLAVEAIDRLISSLNTPYFILSYSSGGRATAEELFEILEKRARILQTLKIDYQKNVMAEMRWTNRWLNVINNSNYEFLFLAEKK